MKLSFVLQNQVKPPWRVVFFGTDEFSLHVLKALFENRVTEGSPSCVVKKLVLVHPFTKKMTPVQRFASFCDLGGFDWPLKNAVKNFDVGILASFGHLVPAKVISMFPYGIINVHPSLLPQWRGAAPVHHTILSGSQTTGVSIMALQPKHFDVGPVLLHKDICMPSKSTTFSLREQLGALGGNMIIDVLSSLPQYLQKCSLQKGNHISYAHKLTQSHSFIDWQHQSRDEIDRQYRALHESMELRSVWDGRTIRLLGMTDVDHLPAPLMDANSMPGLPVFCKKEKIVWIKCKDGWVGFKEIVIKKKMTAQAFYNGYLSKPQFKDMSFSSVPNNLFGESYHRWIENPRSS